MSVIPVQFQTLEEIYRLVWTAVRHRQTNRSHVPAKTAAILPASTWPESGRTTAFLLPVWWRESERTPSHGSRANWRCVALEKLSRVKLLQDAWHTAPNHSRPGSCVSKPDMDVEDYPEPDPQKGH